MSKFSPRANPILILSDRPEDNSGLARVCRDIASLAQTMAEFRVAVLGRGSEGLRSFAWTSYSYPEAAGWGQYHLERITKDFFGSDYGVVLSNWDVSRLTWLPRSGRNWDVWLYAPVDNTSCDGQRLGIECRSALPAFTRIMAASEWGAGVLRRSGRPDAEWLPHGLPFGIWKPHPAPRPLLGWSEDDIWAGCVMTNQARKDWPVAFETIALLRAQYGDRFRAWCHIDTAIRYWNLEALAHDYGVSDCIEVTTDRTDEHLALRYSACDVTILPSAAEGFGFPIAESMACGTACIVTDYAAGQELVMPDCRVPPVTYRIDTIYNVRRAVLSGYGFAAKAHGQIEKKRSDREFVGEELREHVSHLDWQRLKHPWERWLREGLK